MVGKILQIFRHPIRRRKYVSLNWVDFHTQFSTFSHFIFPIAFPLSYFQAYFTMKEVAGQWKRIFEGVSRMSPLYLVPLKVHCVWLLIFVCWWIIVKVENCLGGELASGNKSAAAKSLVVHLKYRDGYRYHGAISVLYSQEWAGFCLRIFSFFILWYTYLVFEKKYEGYILAGRYVCLKP